MAFGQTSPTPETSTFEFTEPQVARYHVPPPSPLGDVRKSFHSAVWLKAWRRDNTTNYVEFSNRIVLEVRAGTSLAALIDGTSLKVSRPLASHLAILEAPDTWTALNQAQRLAKDPRVTACYPIARRPKQLFGRYAPRLNDPFFFQTDHPNSDWQPYLENRDSSGMQLGVDLNVRAAWAISRGHDITLALADNGVDLDHPDLAPHSEAALHFNFLTGETNGLPAGPSSNHGTAVAGIAAAVGNNGIGISGVAPSARLASWVLFNASDRFAISDEALMDMFQYKSNIVSIQNHSWGNDGIEQLRFTSIEDLAISNAVTFGRHGRGIVMVRAGGNGRLGGNNANDDNYPSDPRAIAVAAVRFDGRVARYSTPGACILVAAPSGDMPALGAADETTPCTSNSPNLLTTDRRGPDGFSIGAATDETANYTFGSAGFSGTSASSPQIAGTAALILSANTNLTYRDVQQILVHTSRHFDFADPDLTTNGAGFGVSHNLGFGVPDAGFAVALAKRWPNRPPLTNAVFVATNSMVIPDLGLRVLVEGANVPSSLQSIVALPGMAPHSDVATASLPVVDIGTTTNGIQVDLNGRAALIQRGGNFFCEKLSLAATAGASFAIVFNNRDVDARILMGATEFSPIPGVFISQTDGEALRRFVSTNSSARAQLRLTPVQYSFAVKESLLCEHVAVRIDTDHTARGDLRITLVSPQGTRSVMQTLSTDKSPGPIDWTYHSTHHFYESSVGTWTINISDEDINGTGQVKRISLLISGVPIIDSDADGLDDRWELDHFQTLAFGPQDDPDQDGYNNAREQIIQSNPKANDVPFQLDLSLWDEKLARLSWPSSTNTVYQIKIGSNSGTPLALATNLPGRFPETEWFVPYTNLTSQFFGVQAVPLNPAPR